MQHSPSAFLQESFLIAERQKAVMFATLNRARKTLEDQGAQVWQCFSRRGGINADVTLHNACIKCGIQRVL